LTIVYTADVDGARLRGCDLLTLDDDSRIISGEPCVGGLAQDRPSAGATRLPHEAIAIADGGPR
jgi:hypothetical protein